MTATVNRQQLSKKYQSASVEGVQQQQQQSYSFIKLLMEPVY